MPSVSETALLFAGQGVLRLEPGDSARCRFAHRAARQAPDPLGVRRLPPLVLLRLEVVLAETFSQARMRAARGSPLPASVPPTTRYIGTPAGLAGLIADICAADVADGVVVAPTSASEPGCLAAAMTGGHITDYRPDKEAP